MKNGKRILSVKVKRMLDDSPDTSHLGEYSMTRKSEFSIDRAHAEDCASVSLIAKQARETLEHAQQTVGDLFNAVLAQYNGTLANEKLDGEREALNDAYDQLGELSDEVVECDCGKRGDMGRNEYRYFNPSFNYVDKADKLQDGLTAQDVRKYVRQDYERMESLAAGNWCYIGIQAQAEIGVGDFTKYGQGYNIQTIISGGLWGIESNSDAAYLESEEKEQLADLRDQLLMLGFSRRAISTAFKNVEHETE